MANLCEVTPEVLADFEQWLNEEERPDTIREIARKFPPWKLYRMKSTNQRVTIVSYSEFEDDSVGFMVHVSGQYNRVLFSRSVFGIKSDDLEECDLPGPGEDVGDTAAEAGYNDDDIRDILIPRLKAAGAFDPKQ